MTSYLNPINWFRWGGQFFVTWVMTASWRGTAKAIPAFLVLCLMAGGTALVWSDSQDWRNRMVDRQLGFAMREGDFEVADLLLQRRIRVEPENRKLQLSLASVREQAGETEAAAELYRSLAVDFEDATAARWLLANTLKPEEARNWSEEQLSDYGKTTSVLVKRYPDDLSGNLAHADFLLKDGQLEEAVPYLEKVIEIQPSRGLEVAIIFRKMGRESQALATAKNYLSLVEDLVLESPKDSRLRVTLAQVLLFLKREEDALNSIVDAYNKLQDDRLRVPVAEVMVLVAASARANSQDVEALKRSLLLLQNAAKLAPNNPAVLKAISDTVLFAMTNEGDNEQIEAITNSITEGAAPEIAHFIRGTVALLNDQPEIAANELTLATKAMPQSPAILNNLAVATASLAKKDQDLAKYQEAMSIVTKAIDLVSGKSGAEQQLLYFRETRGQISLGLGEYLDAITDLEAALRIPELREQVHRSLAKAYSAIGQTDDAVRHEQLAESLMQGNGDSGTTSSEPSMEIDEEAPSGEGMPVSEQGPR